MFRLDRIRRGLCAGTFASAVIGSTRAAAAQPWVTLKARPAPAVDFSDAAGKALTLGHFTGRPALVNLWATWCAPCLAELPALDRLQTDVGRQRLAVVALSLDRRGLLAVIATFRRLHVQGLGIYVDPTGNAADELGATGLPVTLLITAQGALVARRLGAIAWDAPAERLELFRRLEL